MKRFLAPLALLASAPALNAHPHIFVDTAITIVVDDAGLATRIDMTWTYDDFFTLLILEDEGLDPDGDGVLTAEEEAQMKGFDLELWPEGFEGDLYAFDGDEKLEMPRPEPVSATVVEGRIRSLQRREIPPTPIADLKLQQYDPTYYVAYTVVSVEVEGAVCDSRVQEPDPDAYDSALIAELQELSEDSFEVMQVGVHFAQTITMACAPRS